MNKNLKSVKINFRRFPFLLRFLDIFYLVCFDNSMLKETENYHRV